MNIILIRRTLSNFLLLSISDHINKRFFCTFAGIQTQDIKLPIQKHSCYKTKHFSLYKCAVNTKTRLHRSLRQLDRNCLRDYVRSCPSYCPTSRDCRTWTTVVSNVHSTSEQSHQGMVVGRLLLGKKAASYYLNIIDQEVGLLIYTQSGNFLSLYLVLKLKKTTYQHNKS